jgi:carboxymethylenebutenolidase
MVGTLAAFAFAISFATPVLQSRPKGFLADTTEGRGPAVLVLHPWWGLNNDVKSFCKRLSQEGYLVFAPDLFKGKIASSIPQAEALIKAAKSNEVEKIVETSSQYLANRTKKSIAAIGFSFGAPYALQLSNTKPDRVRSVVVFYGTGYEDFSKSKAAYLGHFAENDEFEPKEAVDGLTQALKKSNRPATIHTYRGIGHWFFEPSRKDAYNKTAAELAWQRTVGFLKKSAASLVG